MSKYYCLLAALQQVPAKQITRKVMTSDTKRIITYCLLSCTTVGNTLEFLVSFVLSQFERDTTGVYLISRGRTGCYKMPYSPKCSPPNKELCSPNLCSAMAEKPRCSMLSPFLPTTAPLLMNLYVDNCMIH